jgi:hypothetical protein
MRKIRHIPAGGALVEVTTRTQQGRFLLRPSQEFNQITVGVLALALKQAEGITFCGAVVASSHYHALLWAPDAQQLAKFMEYFNGQLGRLVARLHNWTDKVWSRRYQAIVVSDEEGAHENRLRYLLSHGLKEDLVWNMADWPGIPLAKNLVEGEPLRGYWINRSKLRVARAAAKRKGQHPKAVDPMDFATFYEVPVEPLPGWADRPAEEYRAYVADLVKQIEQATWERRMRDKPPILGRSRILKVDPQHRPEHIKVSPAPAFHAATFKALKALKETYAWFVEAYRHAAEELKKGNLNAVFPGGCFPPGLPFVPG